MSVYLSKEGLPQCALAFAPNIQQWETDGDDTELTLHIEHNGRRIELTAEFLNDMATFNWSVILKSLFEDRTMPILITDLSAKNLITDYNLVAYITAPYTDKNNTPVYSDGMVVNGVAQFGESNMARTQVFLTSFQRLKKYEGYPLGVSFIIKETTYPLLNGQSIKDGGGEANWEQYNIGEGKHLTLIDTEDATIVSIANSPMDIYLRDDDYNIITDAAYNPITVALPANYQLFDQRSIDHYPAPQHPFYVRWINQQGGWDYWMFACRQTLQRSLTNTTVYTPYIEDISTARGDKAVISKEAAESVQVSSGPINPNEWDVISRILYSPRIEKYISGEGGDAVWQTLLLDKGDASIGTHAPTGEIQLTFNLPTPQLQF